MIERDAKLATPFELFSLTDPTNDPVGTSSKLITKGPNPVKTLELVGSNILTVTEKTLLVKVG
jgi:hypothetical protein